MRFSIIWFIIASATTKSAGHDEGCLSAMSERGNLAAVATKHGRLLRPAQRERGLQEAETSEESPVTDTTDKALTGHQNVGAKEATKALIEKSGRFAGPVDVQDKAQAQRENTRKKRTSVKDRSLHANGKRQAISVPSTLVAATPTVGAPLQKQPTERGPDEQEAKNEDKTQRRKTDKVDQQGVEHAAERGPDSGVGNSTHSHTTPVTQDVRKSDTSGKEDMAANPTAAVQLPPAERECLKRSKTASVSATCRWSSMLRNLPMTQGQRLEMLLDYTAPLSGLLSSKRQDKSKTSTSRIHSGRRTEGANGHRSRLLQRKNTQRVEAALPGHRSAATIELMNAARRRSRVRSRKALTRYTAKLQSGTTFILGILVLAALGLYVGARYRDDRGALRVIMGEHSPHFITMKRWAAGRRAALAARPGLRGNERLW